MARVIHTGDTHLGYRQYHSPRRREDFLAAFRRVVEDAIEEEVDAVVHAGDLFHDRSPALTDVHGAIRILRDLRDAEIPFLAVVGNHERTREGQWVDLFATLGLATRLGREPTTVGDVAFYGLDYVPPSRRDDLEYDFEPHEAAFAALVAHGPFEPFVPDVRSDRWDLEAALDAASVEFDAALLGDDHTADTVEIDGAWATYCGSTERVAADERDERGYNIVEFDDDVRISRRGVETRRFVRIGLELGEGEDVSRIRDRLREEDLEDAVVVVSIEGGGEEVPPATVEEFALDRGALVARVSDRREVESAESVPAVSFADPDEAVRERLRELGLSEAATAIDATVRDDGIAGANVRERVRERIEEFVEEDPGALERPDVDERGDVEGADESEEATVEEDEAVSDADAEAGGEVDEASVEETGATTPGRDAGEAAATDEGATAAEPAPGGDAAESGEGETSAPPAQSSPAEPDETAEEPDSTSGGNGGGADDGETTIEDFL